MNLSNWSNWYSQQYRTRTITQTPYLARTGTNTSQVATAMAQQQNAQTDNANPKAKDKKSSDPLFGPSIGPVSSGPAWTMGSEKKVVTDELTPEIVNSWVEKSKEPSQPTTTLQALVNLKHDPSSANMADQHHHGLEFEYDCDAPKCGIYVHVHLPKDHPDAVSTSSISLLSKLLVFETVVDGGFANHLTLEEGAMLELGRFENAHVQPLVNDNAALPSIPEPSTLGDFASPTLAGDASSPTASRNNGRRRFTHFHFRKRSQNRSISGPALAVVDAEPVVAQEGKAKEGNDDAEQGVRVTIRLAALDEQGTELASPNEQITYLHIVRLGHSSTDVPKEGGEPAEDARPWVVKVVKREATIGPHTFHLHEIYGLTSSSTNNTVPLPTAHTYPPEEGQQATPVFSVADNEDPQSECLLCLSSPREVVLLPCRHLVACKECALNMVEFGAGGTISQVVEVGAGLNEGGSAASPSTATPAPLTPTTNPRRKRKAKGWFCPVCRQPYTSMLRITTAPPPQSENKDNDGSGTEDEGSPTPPTTDNGPTNEGRSGLLGSALRPGFLRGLTLSRSTPVANPDVESQAGLGRVGA
ncbi:hypothetical protein BYT27DRAFT_7229273 [Phlegmacium glaucopus]|nr:hypothetical protein BYT27DRAFT_7229273 [Phlegmacium glaucopus]